MRLPLGRSALDLGRGWWEVHSLTDPCLLKGSGFSAFHSWFWSVTQSWLQSIWLGPWNVAPQPLTQGNPQLYFYEPGGHGTYRALSKTIWNVHYCMRCRIIDVVSKKAEEYQKWANIYTKVVENQIKHHQRFMEPGAAIVLFISNNSLGKCLLAFQ